MMELGYACLLDDQPSVLVPRRALERRREAVISTRNLVVNPSARILPLSGAMMGAAARLCLVDQRRGIYDEFGLTADSVQALAKLSPGQRIDGNCLDPLQRSLLIDCGLLLAEGVSLREEINTEWSLARVHFLQHKFVVVSDIIHPYHVGALRRYFRWLVRSGHISLGDRQVSRRWWSHNDPVARLFHRQLTPIVGRVVGESVKPSYVYLAGYESGSVLKRHRDRPQCAFSVTVCIDYTPEPMLESQWPINLGTEGGDVSVFQSLGDGLVYAGCQLTHFRDKLPDGHFSMSLLFHYVPVAFEGPLH